PGKSRRRVVLLMMRRELLSALTLGLALAGSSITQEPALAQSSQPRYPDQDAFIMTPQPAAQAPQVLKAPEPNLQTQSLTDVGLKYRKMPKRERRRAENRLARQRQAAAADDSAAHPNRLDSARLAHPHGPAGAPAEGGFARNLPAVTTDLGQA